MRYLLGFAMFLGWAGAAAAQGEKIGDRTVKQWTALLDHKDVKVRLAAVAALYEQGPDAAPLLKQLIPLLRDSSPTVRRAVAQTLGNFKSDAAPAVPALVAAIKDTDPVVRKNAYDALIEVGNAAEPGLIVLLDHKDATMRQYALLSMNGLSLQSKEATKAMLKATKDMAPLVRQAALFALSKLESDEPEILTTLAGALGDKDKTVRQAAATFLVAKGKPATNAIAEAVDDVNVDQRILAIQVLGALGENIDEKGVLRLRKALKDDVLKVRQAAAQSIVGVAKVARELGGDKEMVEALLAVLKDKDAVMRRSAMQALGQIGSDDTEEIKTILSVGLKDVDTLVRGMTVTAMTKFLKDTVSDDNRKLMTDQLFDLLKDGDRRIQTLAAQALVQQSILVVEPLTKLVEENKGIQRLWAAQILGEIGSGAADAVPALEKMAMMAMDVDTRRIATQAIQKIKNDSK